MSWQVNYTIEHADGTCINTMFNEDPDLGKPDYQVVGNNVSEAIENAKEYIKEIYEENCLRVDQTESKLIVLEPSDNEFICTYKDFSAVKLYTLIDASGKQYTSTIPGTLGGHKKLKIYGKLNCPSANRYIQKGEYVKYRVFFKDEDTAIAAGYRPCAVCMREQYELWKKKYNDKT